MSPNEEKKLVQKAMNGDRQALGLIWDELTPKLFGYLIDTIRNRTLAEDILQTTWLKAIDNLSKFEPRGVGFGAWLFAIAKNECRQYWRNQKHETSFNLVEHDQPDISQDNPETAIFINQSLGLLSEEDRELIRLRYIADLSLHDIASILKLNPITVRVRIHRAIARLRDAIVFNK